MTDKFIPAWPTDEMLAAGRERLKGYTGSPGALALEVFEKMSNAAPKNNKLDRLEELQQCVNEWFAKTEWLNGTYTIRELGLHRADVIKTRFDSLQVQMSKMREQSKDTLALVEKLKATLSKVEARFFRHLDTSQDSLYVEVYEVLTLTPETAQTLSQAEIKHLEWIYARMENTHGENKNVDFMRKFQTIIDTLKGTET